MKHIVILFYMFFFPFAKETCAAQLYVGWGQYSSIQTAVNLASSHDTIYVNNNTYSENVIINQPVHIFGSGFYANNQSSIINGRIILNSAGSGSSLSGLIIMGNPTDAGSLGYCVCIGSNTNNIRIESCTIKCNESQNNYFTMIINNYTSNIFFSKCIIQNTGNDLRHYGIYAFGPTEINVSNSIFSKFHQLFETSNIYSCSINVNNCTIDRCNLVSANSQFLSSYLNCIFINTNITNCQSLTLNYNCHYGYDFVDCIGLGNFRTNSYPLLSSPNYAYNPVVHDFHLINGCELIDAGDPLILDRDGTRSDIGCTGGPNPFNFTGIPEVPIATWLHVPSQVYQGQSLPVAARGVIGD